MGKRGPDKKYDGQIGVRLTWQQKAHLQEIADDEGYSNLSAAVRHVVDAAIKRRDRNPNADPAQVEMGL